ncbi:MAG: hypothetical protein NTX63_04325 [Candidatus Peregrinibacteria bacterium]|nr:hypothetical protein [Candidatus Peregrinibacteria bacterium]
MNTPGNLHEPITITKAEQSWVKFYARQVAGAKNAPIPRNGAHEEVLGIAIQMDPGIAHRDGTIHLIKNLRSIESRRQNILHLSDEIIEGIGSFRQRIEALLEINPEDEAYAEQPDEQESRASTWLSHILSEHYEDLEPHEITKLSEKEKQARMFVAMTGLQYAPLELLLHSYLENGLHLLNDIRQSTQKESLKYFTSGSDSEEAEQMGYPLPTEEVLQKDFLQIDIRKVKMEELRKTGNVDEIAAYEADCCNAIYAAFMGYQQATDAPRREWKANKGVEDIAKTKLRDCLGAALQSIHWMKELGIKVLMLRTLESPVLDEGHMSMIIIDSKGKRHFFDPALRKPYTPMPNDYYTDPKIDAHFEEVINGKRKQFRVEAADARTAYMDINSPHGIVMSAEDGMLQALQYVTLYSKTKDEKTHRSLIATWGKIAGNQENSDRMPMNFLDSRLINDYYDGSEGVKASGNMIIERYPDSSHMLNHIGLVLNGIGNISGSFKILQILMKKTLRAQSYLNESISELEKGACMPGKNVTRVIFRHLHIIECIERVFDHLTMLIDKIEYFPELDACYQDFFKLMMTQIIRINTFMRNRGLTSETASIEKIIAKGVIAGARTLEMLQQAKEKANDEERVPTSHEPHQQDSQ